MSDQERLRRLRAHGYSAVAGDRAAASPAPVQRAAAEANAGVVEPNDAAGTGYGDPPSGAGLGRYGSGTPWSSAPPWSSGPPWSPGPPQPRFPDAGSWTSPGYRSADTRATVAQILYGILGLTAVALAVATAGGFELLDRAERFIWEQAAYDSWSDTVNAIADWQSIFAFIAGLAFISWLSRYVDNVPPLGGGTPKRSPRRVIVYWLVPIISLIFLPLILNDVARRQSRDGAGHRTLILVWWLLYVFPLLALIWELPIFLDEAGTDWVRNVLMLAIIERIAFAVQAVVTIVMIRRLQDDEYFQAEHWGSHPGGVLGANPLSAANAPDAWGRAPSR